MLTYTRFKNWISSAKVSPSEDKHVAVLAFPFGSHAGPLLNLVRRIAAESPNVTFSFFGTSKSNAPLFNEKNDHVFSNISAYSVHDGLPEGFVPSRNPFEPISLFIKAMPQNYKDGIKEAENETGRKITCLVTDAFYWFGADLAEEMRAKWIPLWTAGPHAALIHVLTDLIREKIGCDKDVGDDQMIDFLPGFPELKATELPAGVVKDIETPFAKMLHNMGLALPRATAVAINSFASIHIPTEKELEPKLKLLLNVGPFTLTTPQPVIQDEQGCLKWLDKHEGASVVYIGFGSVVIPPPHELTALAEALEESKFPFIWAFRGDPEEQLPKGFMERTKTKGKIVGWAPQIDILKHASVGVCLTHGGWNSVLDCIVGGVPIICRPFFGDQGLNTWMLQSVWGIGVGFENGVMTKEGTMQALELTMSSEKGEVMRKKMRELKETALSAVERNGSSTKNFDTLTEIVTS